MKYVRKFPILRTFPWENQEQNTVVEVGMCIHFGVNHKIEKKKEKSAA